MPSQLSDIGVIGLAVMGQNLALNLADHGFRVSVYNRTYTKAHELAQQNPHTPGGLIALESLEAFIQSIARPRKIILLVKAGQAVDDLIDTLLPKLAKASGSLPADLLIDAGNTLWTDTMERSQRVTDQGISYAGMGLSGGEEGARFGPSLMFGGRETDWQQLAPLLKAVAAKVDPSTGKALTGAQPGKPIVEGAPCAAHIGSDGAGHYVKMVHNGIEYGDMQMICEAYDWMRTLLGLAPSAISTIFTQWNQGRLDSYLIEITADILQQQDPETEQPIVDVILDAAQQKGTGQWTSLNAVSMGTPAPTIVEAVLARCMSARYDERQQAADRLSASQLPPLPHPSERDELLQVIHDALYASKICSYAQGFQLMRDAQKEYNWKLNFAEIAQIWRGGCIIRAAFLEKITEAYRNDPDLPNLLLDSYFQQAIRDSQKNWRRAIALAAQHGIPTPCFSSALAYYDSYRSKRLPHNLLQAQRDYFGAHTYERIDKPRGQHFHLDWFDPKRPESPID